MNTIPMPIYMDNNATTPLDPRVFAAMEPYFKEMFGNAASNSHAYGWQVQTAVKKAREQVAALVGCRASDVIWTSGATESNNMAITGLVRTYCKERPHLITQATEHKAVLEVVEAAQELGAEITILPVDNDGRVRMTDVQAAVRPNTILISIMTANNEVGTLQPVAQIAELCRERKIVFHTDAAQSACKVSASTQSLRADLISLSGHKVYGPKGVGALIVRKINRDFELKPLMLGGEQERKLRPGTLNIAGIVGLGQACELGRAEQASECERLHGFQKALMQAVLEKFPKVKLNGCPKDRLSNNLSFSFPDVMADDMALGLSGIAYSSGSACNSSNPKPSHVLTAMGVPDALARATLRLGLGRFTTKEEVDQVKGKLLNFLEKVYGSSH